MDDPTLLEYRLPFRARITGQATVGGVRRYTWVEQAHDSADGATADATPGREGTATSSWAVELNNADVPDDTIVWLRFRGMALGVPCYELSQGTPGPPGAAGGTITVEEADGSPSLAGVTKITTNQAQGLRVTGTSPVAAMSIDLASDTQTGVVGLTGQQLGRGAKWCREVSGSDDYYIHFYAAPAGSGTGTQLFVNNQSAVRLLHVSSGAAASQMGMYVDTTAQKGAVGYKKGPTGPSAELVMDPAAQRITAYGDTGPGTVWSLLFGAYGFSVYRSGAFTDGIDGTRTVKDGAGVNKTVTIQGGIITSWAT